MTVRDWLYIIPMAFGAVVVVVGMWKASWLRIQKVTNDLLTAQNAQLRCSYDDLQKKFDDSMHKISSLEGKVAVLECIPLQSIDATLKLIAATNDTLTRTNQHILETLEAAGLARAGVKQDLLDHDAAQTDNVR